MPNFTFKATGQLLQDTFQQWLEVNATRMGAALSYYSVFSLGPLLIISIAVASFFFGDEAARGQIFEQLRGTMGDGGAQAVEALVKGAQKNSTGETATLLSVITLLVGATGVVVQVIYRPLKGAGFQRKIHRQSLCFLLFLF